MSYAYTCYISTHIHTCIHITQTQIFFNNSEILKSSVLALQLNFLSFYYTSNIEIDFHYKVLKNTEYLQNKNVPLHSLFFPVFIFSQEIIKCQMVYLSQFLSQAFMHTYINIFFKEMISYNTCYPLPHLFLSNNVPWRALHISIFYPILFNDSVIIKIYLIIPLSKVV